MDVSSMSSAVSRASTGNQVSVQVAKIAMDQAKSQGQAANQLIQAAADVQKASTGRNASGGVDTYG